MESQFSSDAVAILLLRSVTGILFFFQGHDKIFNVKISNVVRTFYGPLTKCHIPVVLLKPAIAVSSFLEMICGFFLIFGLFKTIDLYLLTANLILVALIFSSMKAMWDMKFFFPRLILIILLLFTLGIPDIISLDWLINSLKN